ncbi:sugar ABC transporter permease [Catellatospora sp. IY07-71]|uniref:carbohydrate ABC transporter permease n=1 Tax=Catellatospora sp. IY07-71 TaxID=2728827 RepID=UPI001BB6E932|nr:sugar ABC transporter permease [Catellatospora sp. IY07-71]BCJ74408.1 sugar ABC transporter permease [Catellatospora sp. IY07-71]
MVMTEEGIAADRAAVPAPAPGGRARRPRRWTAEAGWAYLLIAPTGLGLAVFYLWPVLQTGYFSFTEWGPFGGHEWVGLDNYRALAADTEVRQALVNTLLFALLGLLGIPLAIVFAALLNRPKLRGVSVYRALFFIPVVTMPVAVAMVWRWLYNGDFGLVNQFLSVFGVEGPHWIADPATALYALVAVCIWAGLGYNIVVFLAGLQAIPREFYEAAEIDGAGPVAQFRRVTLPLLSPSIFFVSVLSVIGSLQLFDLVYVMAGSGQAARSNPAMPRIQTVVGLFYDKAFYTNDRGYAAAIVMALLVLIVVFTAIQFRLQKRWVHYG